MSVLQHKIILLLFWGAYFCIHLSSTRPSAFCTLSLRLSQVGGRPPTFILCYFVPSLLKTSRTSGLLSPGTL